MNHESPEVVADATSGAPTFGKFITLLREHNIGRSVGYELREAGLIDVFHIGKTPYAYRASFAALPKLLADPEVQARLAEIKRKKYADPAKRRGRE
jgi:hypothetical protein